MGLISSIGSLFHIGNSASNAGHIGLVGAWLNNKTGNATFDRQVALNQMQEDYQMRNMQYQNRFNAHMSNTEVQRRTKDMEAAGINPVLSVTSGQNFEAYAPSSAGAYASGQFGNQAYTGQSNGMNSYNDWLNNDTEEDQNESWHAGARYGRSAERSIGASEEMGIPEAIVA